VINSNVPPILHRFRDSLGKVQNRYIWLILFGLTPPSTEGFPWEDFRETFTKSSYIDGQGTKWLENIAENFNPLSRANERYRRQTDDRDRRTTTYSEQWTWTCANNVQSFIRK